MRIVNWLKRWMTAVYDMFGLLTCCKVEVDVQKLEQTLEHRRDEFLDADIISSRGKVHCLTLRENLDSKVKR